MEDNKKKKTIFHFIVLMAIIIPVILSISYAYFQAVIIGEDAGVTGRSTNTFEINLETENNGYINGSNILLITAKEAATEAQKGYFKVVSGDNKHFVTYTLSLTELTISSNLQVSDFKWQLVRNNNVVANGTFEEVSTNSMELVTGVKINKNITHEYELRLWIEEREYDQLSLLEGSFSGKVSLVADMKQNPVQPLLKDLIMAQGGGASVIEAKGNPNFANIATAIDTGLYATEDEYGMSYYYRGERELLNNNLIFGGYQWKIIRINGDGSIRIMYNGTETEFNTNGTMNTTGTNTQLSGIYAWNTTNNNDAKYVGYMYGGANGVASTSRNGEVSTAATYNETSSNVKFQLDSWYETNISGKAFERYIVDNLFCNDRQKQDDPGVGGAATGSGYGESETYYAAYHRLVTNKTPTLKCGQKNDRFTKNDTIKGNGALTYPVGLITADEATMVGLIDDVNNTNYLYTDQLYWVLTPNSKISSVATAAVWRVTTAGRLSRSSVSLEYGLRAVLNLVSDIAVIGEGTKTNPYKVIN